MPRLSLQLPPRQTRSLRATQSTSTGSSVKTPRTLQYFQLVDAAKNGRDFARFVVVISVFDPVNGTAREEQVSRWDVVSLAQAGPETDAEAFHASWVGQTIHYGLFDSPVMSLNAGDAIKICKKRLQKEAWKGRLRVPEEISRLEQSLRRQATIERLQQEENAAMQNTESDFKAHGSPRLDSGIGMADVQQHGDVDSNLNQSEKENAGGPRPVANRTRHSSEPGARQLETPSTPIRAQFRRLAAIGDMPIPQRFRENDTAND